MKQVFINLPVEDPERSKKFYHSLGFTDYPLFTGDSQACVAWSELVFVVLQTKDFFSSGNNKPTADARQHISASFTLPVESLDKVHLLIENGLKAGGTIPKPFRDEGFMQVGTLEYPDGHTWSFIHLDMDAFRKIKEG